MIAIDASRATAVQRTGVEQYAFNLIQDFKRIIPSGYRVVLYSPQPLTGELGELPPNWENRVLSWPPRRLWTQFRLSWEMFRRPPDLLFVPAHVLPLVLPRHVVTTMHDVAFMSQPRAYSPWGLAYLVVDAWLAVRRAAILTVSDFSKSEIIRKFGAEPARIAVTPLGFDAERYRPATTEAIANLRSANGLKEAPYFLFIGRLERKKNLAGLLRAFAAFKRRRGPGDGVRLVLAGKPGRGYAAERAAIAGDPAEKFVSELGFVPDADVPALYSGAIATMLVSWYEGFGLPVIESGACDTPAIVSDRTSMLEVAKNGALFVDPSRPEEIANAMARLADDPRLRARLAAEASDNAHRYSWETCAGKSWLAIRSELER